MHEETENKVKKNMHKEIKDEKKRDKNWKEKGNMKRVGAKYSIWRGLTPLTRYPLWIPLARTIG